MDLRKTLFEFLKIHNQTLSIEIDNGLLNQLFRTVDQSLTNYTERPQRPPDGEIVHLGKVLQILADSYEVMDETPLWYESTLQAALLLGPCRAVNMIMQKRSLFNTMRPPDRVERAPPNQSGMPQQRTKSVVPDLMVFPHQAGSAGSEVKLKTVLDRAACKKVVQLAGAASTGPADYSGIRVSAHRVGHEDELRWECANRDEVSAVLQKILCQVRPASSSLTDGRS